MMTLLFPEKNAPTFVEAQYLQKVAARGISFFRTVLRLALDRFENFFNLAGCGENRSSQL